MYPPTSRYHLVETAMHEIAEERTVTYLRRRFLPRLDGFAVLEEHEVTEGDRLDNIAARYLGDPQQFWRLCDANPVLRPRELEEPGRHILIILPEGIPGGHGV